MEGFSNILGREEMNELIFMLTIELAKKQRLSGPELHTYLRGLHFCEGIISVYNESLEEENERSNSGLAFGDEEGNSSERH